MLPRQRRRIYHRDGLALGLKPVQAHPEILTIVNTRLRTQTSVGENRMKKVEFQQSREVHRKEGTLPQLAGRSEDKRFRLRKEGTFMILLTDKEYALIRQEMDSFWAGSNEFKETLEDSDVYEGPINNIWEILCRAEKRAEKV